MKTHVECAVFSEGHHSPQIVFVDVNDKQANFAGVCKRSTAEDDLLQLATPFLLPCVLEFCVLAAAALYSLWVDVPRPGDTDIRKRSRRRSAHFDLPDLPVHLTEINFHKTHRGLFTGVFLFAAAAVSIILYFSYLSTSDNKEVPRLIHLCSDMALYAILLVVVSLTWFHVALLSFVYTRRVTVDEFVLFVALTGLLTFNVCESFALVQHLTDFSADRDVILMFADNVLCMTLTILQTCFIVQSYSRQSTRSIHLKQKPGRGGITFLLITNISMWLLRSFQLKYAQVKNYGPHRDMFGSLVWQIIFFGTLPFTIFYHFQASACFAHIWIKCYRKNSPRDTTPSVRSGDMTEEVTLVPTSGEIRIVELKRRIRKSTGVTEEDTVFSPVSVV